VTRGVIFVFAVLVLCIVVFRVWAKRREPEHTFRCADGTDVHATFADDSVRLRLPSGDATLPLAMSASGARYANDSLEFWEHAGEARISVRGTAAFEHCRPAE
jgi:membrane-bound inhibitor of C-type lysozyme